MSRGPFLTDLRGTAGPGRTKPYMFFSTSKRPLRKCPRASQSGGLTSQGAPHKAAVGTTPVSDRVLAVVGLAACTVSTHLRSAAMLPTRGCDPVSGVASGGCNPVSGSGVGCCRLCGFKEPNVRRYPGECLEVAGSGVTLCMKAGAWCDTLKQGGVGVKQSSLVRPHFSKYKRHHKSSEDRPAGYKRHPTARRCWAEANSAR
jgi:hypothetical protein